MRFQVPWKFRDFLLVTLVCHFSPIYLYPLGALFFSISRLFHNDASARFTFLLYLASLLNLFLPILWIWRFHKANTNTLGLKKGGWPVHHVIFIGIGVGAACYCIGFSILGHQLMPAHLIIVDQFHSLIFSSLTAQGLRHYILSPISEEVLDRGFIYGYLRSKLGVWLGLFVQALIFTAGHFPTDILRIIQVLFLGLVLGALYEISGSLYPSMICHGVVNFLNTIFEQLGSGITN